MGAYCSTMENIGKNRDIYTCTSIYALVKSIKDNKENNILSYQQLTLQQFCYLERYIIICKLFPNMKQFGSVE